MKQQLLLLTILFFHLTKTLSQSPATAPVSAATPPPAGAIAQPPAAASPNQGPPLPPPTNVTKILEKAGHFSIFIRLLKATQEDNHLLTVLNNSNNGMTILAPSDNAFASLKAGTLNALPEEGKTELVKFHMLPSFITISQFQTVSNPVNTEAGRGGRVSLNVTTYPNSVNITTGLTNTTISATVYTDNQLAIYKVDKVLLPMDIFTPTPPAPTPAPVGPVKPTKKKKGPVAETPVVSVVASGASGVLGVYHVVVIGFVSLMFVL